MDQGLFLIGLPEDTLALVKMLSQKTGQSFPNVIADALAFYAKKKLELNTGDTQDGNHSVGQVVKTRK